MENTMQPLLRDLIYADDDRARAVILLAMPDNIALHYDGAICRLLHKAGFADGIAYHVARIAALLSTRGVDGQLRQNLTDQLEKGRAALVGLIQ